MGQSMLIRCVICKMTMGRFVESMTQEGLVGRKEKIPDVSQEALTAEEKRDEASALTGWVLVARNGVGEGSGSRWVLPLPIDSFRCQPSRVNQFGHHSELTGWTTELSSLR